MTRTPWRSIVLVAACAIATAPCSAAVFDRQLTAELPGWQASAALSAAACDGAVAFVRQDQNAIHLLGASETVVALPKGSEPAGIAAGPRGACYVLDGRHSQVFVVREDRVTGSIALDVPDAMASAVRRPGHIAGDARRIVVSIPDLQAIDIIDGAGRQTILGTAFGDFFDGARDWLVRRPTLPRVAEVRPEAGSSDVSYLPAFPIDGPVGLDGDGVPWVLRYGDEPSNATILRYSDATRAFQVFPLAALEAGTIEPAALMFPRADTVAFAAVVAGRTTLVRISSFGDSSRTDLGSASGAFALSTSPAAQDRRGRTWVVDPGRRRLFVVDDAATKCSSSGYAVPIDVFALGRSIGVADSGTRTFRVFDPDTDPRTRCSPW